MKKVFLSAIMLIGLAFSAGAQEKSAIGIRLGDNSGFGAEVSYQRSLSKNNRLEFDLGFRNYGNVYYGNGYYGNGNNFANNGYGHNDIKLVGLYQWVW